MVNILQHWYQHRKGFVIKEASSLLGKLNHADEVAPWARLLFISIRSSLLHCMCKNKNLTMKRKYFKDIISDANNLSDQSIAILRRKFALSKLGKGYLELQCQVFYHKVIQG